MPIKLDSPASSAGPNAGKSMVTNALVGERSITSITNTFRVLRDGQQVREVVSTIHAFGLDEELVLGEIPIGHFGIEEIDEREFATRRLSELRR